ncbi:hypothetical protein BH10ACI2_BH10ACI2_08120 [soil metagenome]
MKKIGMLIFAATLVIGLVVANIFSFGRTQSRFFNFNMSFGSVKGSGNIATINPDISGFNAVRVGGVFQVDITAQKDFGVEIEGDDNILKYIKVVLRNGTLSIEADRKLSPTSPIRVRISAPDIEKLDVSGVANVTLNDLKNSELNIDASGASKIKINGETASLIVDVSGATKIDAENLKAVDANIDASGASDVVVNVSGDLKSEASGASKILYSGSPTNVEKSAHGASRVSPK